MFEKFSVFLAEAATRISSIARSLRGRVRPAELSADAWMLAAEISEKRGTEVDFSCPTDQELILNRLYWRAKDQRDWRLDTAYSIDDSADGATPWADRLAAPISGAPLEILMQREDDARSESAVACSYSQAAAYIVALDNFKSDRDRLCAHLVISGATLGHRMDRAYEIVRRQWSLFHGVQTIDRAFVPLAGRLLHPSGDRSLEGAQAELQF